MSGLSDSREILYENAKSDHNNGRTSKISSFENSRWRTDLRRTVTDADAIGTAFADLVEPVLS